jgi:hypothetical protein
MWLRLGGLWMLLSVLGASVLFVAVSIDCNVVLGRSLTACTHAHLGEVLSARFVPHLQYGTSSLHTTTHHSPTTTIIMSSTTGVCMVVRGVCRSAHRVLRVVPVARPEHAGAAVDAREAHLRQPGSSYD